MKSVAAPGETAAAADSAPISFAEKMPEKPLFQALEDELDDGPIEFKKRKLGNQNARKKK